MQHTKQTETNLRAENCREQKIRGQNGRKNLSKTKQSSTTQKKKGGFKLLPGDLINQTCLEQQVSLWQQIVTDEVLIGPHRYTMAHAERAQHLQHLEHNPSALHPAIV